MPLNVPNNATLAAELPKRLFLTGGSGYVGRNLIRHFTRIGVEIVALVRNDLGAITVERLGARPVRSELLSGSLLSSMQGCDTLIHAAADTTHGFGNAQQAQINVEGTRRVLETARAAGVRRAVHISTDSVLIAGKPLIGVEEDSPFPKKPAGSYSRTKGEAERVACSLATKDFAVLIVRPRFVWGRDDTTALPQLVGAVSSGKFAWIGEGKYFTSTTHIANLCEGVERALERGSSRQAYFITDSEPVQFREFVTALLETQGLTAPTKNIPRSLVRTMAMLGDSLYKITRGKITPPVSLQDFATMGVEVTLSTVKARNELGYVPVITREAGLSELRRNAYAEAL
ncbi:NAD-dependent epimerase/dehydratase family protein [Tunturiibacter lichenicola]|uniref:NAD-dependent epimerase/dehydratase family protein n=1 Tax=Tunturiibacter lichenicola TaxID=2051959 RepID=UPI0021B2B604|nr:NAD-dependent epimerase/dehydratase family protein [Edaphobacter lichenicola]